jgi:hypothetical protein
MICETCRYNDPPGFLKPNLVPLKGTRHGQSCNGLVGVAIDDALGIDADLRNLRADGSRPGAPARAGAFELKDIGRSSSSWANCRRSPRSSPRMLHRRRSTSFAPCHRSRSPRLPPTAEPPSPTEGPRSAGRAVRYHLDVDAPLELVATLVLIARTRQRAADFGHACQPALLRWLLAPRQMPALPITNRKYAIAFPAALPNSLAWAQTVLKGGHSA